MLAPYILLVLILACPIVNHLVFRTLPTPDEQDRLPGNQWLPTVAFWKLINFIGLVLTGIVIGLMSISHGDSGGTAVYYAVVVGCTIYILLGLACLRMAVNLRRNLLDDPLRDDSK